MHQIPVVPGELLQRPLALRTDVGSAHDAITTTSNEAQRYYDQGLAYLHGYMWIQAARAFNQALRLDGRAAMAHVGLSVAYTELNLPALAHESMSRANALASEVSEHERRHIGARQAQVAAEAAPGDGSKLTVYRNALDEALRGFPDDVELLLWRGVAHGSDPADRGQGAGADGVPFFERALKLRDTPAAHHYLTHAYENSGLLAQALEHGQAYAAAAPAVPHAQHMYGHVLRRTGQVKEAIVRFEEADRLERGYFAAESIPPSLDWHYAHNLDLLAASYRYVGQLNRAGTLLRTSFETPSMLAVQMFNKREWPELLLAQGRAPEALSAARVLVEHPVMLVRAVGYIESARAHLAERRFPAAAADANAALRSLRAVPDGAALVGPAFEALQGEYFLLTGQRDRGREMLRSVVTRLRARPGPDNWAQTLFALEAMARSARAAGDWEFAAWLGGVMRDHDDLYAGTHYVLALVAEHNNQVAEATAAFARAEALWSGADADLPELRDIRKRRQ